MKHSNKISLAQPIADYAAAIACPACRGLYTKMTFGALQFTYDPWYWNSGWHGSLLICGQEEPQGTDQKYVYATLQYYCTTVVPSFGKHAANQNMPMSNHQ